MTKLILIRSLSNIPKDLPACAVTIGNFDGFHRGHQALLQRLLAKSKELKIPSVLLTFEPLPNEFFTDATTRLMSLRDKWIILNQYPLNYVLCLKFNQTFADFSALDFIHYILVKKLKTAYLIVGDDFYFGKQRKGQISLLQQEGLKLGFIVDCLPAYQIAGRRVSSSQIRVALKQGDLKTANQLLGRPYSITGRVVKGHQRGRLLGFPTANIRLRQKNPIPLHGVYAVKIVLGTVNWRHHLIEPLLIGVANVGTRPTVDGTYYSLETYIFDYNQDLYGKTMTVIFIQKLRDEKRYDSIHTLQQQIAKDVCTAKHYFKAE